MVYPGIGKIIVCKGLTVLSSTRYTDRLDPVIRKGDPTVDSILGLQTMVVGQTELDESLREGIDTLYICGLATDYCVEVAVLDALTRGYCSPHRDGCRGESAHSRLSKKS